MHSSIPIVGTINLNAEGGVAASRIVRDAHTPHSQCSECSALEFETMPFGVCFALAEERAPEDTASRHRLEEIAQRYRSSSRRPTSA